MDRHINILSAVLASFVLILFASCSEDVVDDSALYDGPIPLKIVAPINGTGNAGASTRATITDKDDQWSYVGFEDKDMMGFYSSRGNWEKEGGLVGFNNLKLQYSAERKQFIGANFSPTHMDGSQIFMYYPYDENMEGKGLELRRTKEDDDTKTLRCVDLLSSNSLDLYGANKDNIALYGEFKHAFSELIIMRGEGFDKPHPGHERITAVLNRGYTNIRVKVSEDPWSCTPELVFDPGGTLSEENARRWDAWQGGNYGITTEDEIGKLAWYIVVPTLPGNRSTVDYIELYDNEDNLLRVSSLRLSGGNSKYLDPGWRYPLEITMKELVPTVNPFPITPWNKEDVDLTDERERGINNEAVFEQWMQAYNAYLTSPDEEIIKALLKYGDMSVDADGNNRMWHFYLLADLDLSSYAEKEGDAIIPKFGDILDGTSTTFVNGKFLNHTIKGLSKTFIGNLENGTVQNIDFIEPEIKNDGSTVSVGIIANSMTDASVINCHIDSGTLYNPDGPAGMVAGSMSGGQVRNCTISGFLAAKSTSKDGLIGEEPTGNATFDNNNIYVAKN